MKHANPAAGRVASGGPVRATRVAAWLSVSALGLAIGALGTGGIEHLLEAGVGGVSTVARATGLVGHSAGTPVVTGEQWQASQVVSPSQIPDGTALAGKAPKAKGAKYGDYTPFVPTSILLPSGRIAAIRPEGVESDGSLEIPADPDQIGWWTGGAQAGEPYGSTVLAGHVDSATFGLGALSEMLSMRPGQVLTLTAGSHSQRYLVQTVRKLPKAELTARTDLFSQNVAHRLVMITCGGPFDRSTHRYRDNVVLVASPIR